MKKLEVESLTKKNDLDVIKNFDIIKREWFDTDLINLLIASH